MVPILYLETHFPLAVAKGQDPDGQQLLSGDGPSTRLILPSVCIIEAIGALEWEQRSQTRDWVRRIDREIVQLSRNRTSPHARRLTALLREATIEFLGLIDETTSRLTRCLGDLAGAVELLHPTPAVVRDALATPRLDDGTDNLILACILDHARATQGPPKAFLSGNVNDFNRGEVRGVLAEAGVEKYFATASDFLGWRRSLGD